VSRPPHRSLERPSVLLLGHHPRTIEAIEFYEDSPSGQRRHVWPEDPPTQPGLAFDTPEDRNCVRELLLRIEDLEHDGTLIKARQYLELPAPDSPNPHIEGDRLLRELLGVMDVIRLKEGE